MKKKKPLLYIITINWNGIKDTLECIRSIKGNEYKNYKIVVVDNGSNQGQADTIKTKYKEIHLIKNKKNRGFCKANNQGIRYALKKNADYILILNNDTVVRQDFIKPLIEYSVAKNNNCAISPKILFYKNNTVWSMGGNISKITSIPKMIGQGKNTSLCTSVIKPEYLTACAFFVSSSVLKKVGYFDEKYFTYYEDTDLSFRLRKLNCPLFCVPKSIIWHKVSRSTNRVTTKKINPVQSYYLARNGLIFGYKNYTSWKRAYYTFAQVFIKMPLYIILKCINWQSRFSYMKGVLDGLIFIT